LTAQVFFRETPVFFAAGGETLFGVLTQPGSSGVRGTVVLVPGGAGTLDGVNRNRLWVRVARDLAARGSHVFRFDYHGAGESTGEAEPLRLDRPFVSDLNGATGWLASQGMREPVLVGSCFGARTALSAAENIPATKGLILATPFVRDVEQGHRTATLMAVGWGPRQYLRRLASFRTVRGLIDRERRSVYLTIAKAKVDLLRGKGISGALGNGKSLISRNFLDPLQGAISRSIPVLLLFGEDDDAYLEFQQEMEKSILGRILDGAGQLVTVETAPGRLHGLRSLASQEAFLALSRAWLERQGFIRTTFDSDVSGHPGSRAPSDKVIETAGAPLEEASS
jgi:pimeloyl-ACP methyl ester carboxylesterase